MRMKKLYVLGIVVVMALVMPRASGATTNANQQAVTGMVTQIRGGQVTIRASTAVSYFIDTATTTFQRKNGAPMQYGEIIMGDKLEVTGWIWGDSSISATNIRNLSLYAHNGTFSGRVTSVDHTAQLFTIQNNTYGEQAIFVQSLTSVRKNSASALFRDIELGMTATVKGVWERSRAHVIAKDVRLSFRLLNIDITGQLAMVHGTALTVVANGVMYAVDASHAKLLNANNKPLAAEKLVAGGRVRVKGKHIAERPHITAVSVKQLILVQ